MPEPDTFLHRVAQLEQALHQGTGLEERWKKSSSTFFQGKLRWDCTGCPTVWQSSGELYLSNLLLEKVSMGLGPLCCSGLGITTECACLLHILQSLAGPVVKACGI